MSGFGAQEEFQLLALLVAAAALLLLADPLRIPYPILLVLGGLMLGFAPGVPELTLPPDVVLIGILPPLLYSAAFNTGLRELRQNLRPISLLAIGLVVLTMVGVAAAAHYAIGLSWAAGFVLGAVVSPTDPLAATAIARRFGVPRRAVAIIEGESLVNDGTALVLLKFAVAAVVTGSFSLLDASASFVWSVIGGMAVGLVVGRVIRFVRRRVFNPPLEVTLAFLTGYFAFLPASAIGASGVLAVVTAGVYMGWHTPELTTGDTRLQGAGFWAIFNFLLTRSFSASSGSNCGRYSRISTAGPGRSSSATRHSSGRWSFSSGSSTARPSPTYPGGCGLAFVSATPSLRGRSSRSSPGRACEEPSRSQRRSRSR